MFLVQRFEWLLRLSSAAQSVFFVLSSQTKIFIGRCCTLGCTSEEGEEENPTDAFESNFAAKKIGIILTYRNADPFRLGPVNALQTFHDMSRHPKREVVGIVYGSALDPLEIRSDQDLLKQTYHLGNNSDPFRNLSPG